MHDMAGAEVHPREPVGVGPGALGPVRWLDRIGALLVIVCDQASSLNRLTPGGCAVAVSSPCRKTRKRRLRDYESPRILHYFEPKPYSDYHA